MAAEIRAAGTLAAKARDPAFGFLNRRSPSASKHFESRPARQERRGNGGEQPHGALRLRSGGPCGGKRRPESRLTEDRPEMTIELTCLPAIPPRTRSRPPEKSAMGQRLSRYMFFAFLLVVASNLPQAQADVALPKVIGSHMVLQRDLLCRSGAGPIPAKKLR